MFVVCVLKCSQNPIETAEFWCIANLKAILDLLQRKTLLFCNFQFLLLLSERGLCPESCSTVFHQGLVAYKKEYIN